MKTITLKKTGYYIKGIAIIKDWWGQTGWIEMEPFTLSRINEKEIIKNLNDNGFGCQEIEGAIVDIFELYEKGLKVFKEERTFNLGLEEKEFERIQEEIIKNYL